MRRPFCSSFMGAAMGGDDDGLVLILILVIWGFGLEMGGGDWCSLFNGWRGIVCFLKGGNGVGMGCLYNGALGV